MNDIALFRLQRSIKNLLNIGFRNEYEATSGDLEVDNEDSFGDHKSAMEMYGFLLAWLISNAEDKAVSKSTVNGTPTTERTNATSTGRTKVYIQKKIYIFYFGSISL